MPRRPALPLSSRTLAAGLLLVAAWAGGAAGVAGAAAEPFADCEARFAADPEGWKSCGCFYSLAAQGHIDEARERLEAHHRRRPELPCPAFNLGRMSLLQGNGEAAAPWLRLAAAGFRERGPPDGEVYARINLAAALADPIEAAAELERARTAAEAEDDLILQAETAVAEAALLLRTGSDFDRAEERLLWVRRRAFPEAHASLRRETLKNLGDLCYRRGRFRQAERYFDEMAAVTAESGDLFGEAAARLNRAAAHLADPSDSRGYEDRNEAALLLGEALEAARAAGHVEAEIEVRARLGALLGGAAGREHLEAALELAGRYREHLPTLHARALAASAVDLLEDDPAEARRRVDEATALLLAGPDPWTQVYGWADRLRVLWATAPREEALAASLRTLELAERLESLQGTADRRAEVASVWSEIHLWLSGRLLLDAEERGDPEALEGAFQVAERMRARQLTEALEGAGVTAAADLGRDEDWRKLQGSLADLNRRLLQPGLGDDERTDLLHRLDTLERREARRLADRQAGAGLLSRRPPLSLADVRGVLADDEALLLFQLGPWEGLDERFAGGAWVLAATRQSARLHRLPDRAELATAVEIFRGLLHEGDGTDGADGAERRPAVRLYDLLLREALASLPPGIERITLVPDGPLHLLPFAALREAESAPPLAARYELTLAPSAALFHRWRTEASRPAGGEEPRSTLVLADPRLPFGRESGETGGAEPARAWTAGLRLGPLPASRREARAALRHLGRPGRMLVGAEASEHAVKSWTGKGPRLLHFGAHAVLDEAYPHRSAVVLAPGAETEDGLLRPREAAALDLRGTVVVLSACRGASGPVLQGEGALSLARAFLQGGARAVVGSLWPIEDRAAADFFDRFYRRLGRGETVSRALAGAQREAAEAGAPAAAWAGFTLLGDGGGVVAPSTEAPRFPAPSAGWMLLAGLLITAVVGIRLHLTRSERR